MNLINRLLAWLGHSQAPAPSAGQKPALLDWFSNLSQAWSHGHANSPTSPGNAPAGDSSPAATPAGSQNETGQALAALLDLLAKKASS